MSSTISTNALSQSQLSSLIQQQVAEQQQLAAAQATAVAQGGASTANEAGTGATVAAGLTGGGAVLNSDLLSVLLQGQADRSATSLAGASAGAASATPASTSGSGGQTLATLLQHQDNTTSALNGSFLAALLQQ